MLLNIIIGKDLDWKTLGLHFDNKRLIIKIEYFG